MSQAGLAHNNTLSEREDSCSLGLYYVGSPGGNLRNGDYSQTRVKSKHAFPQLKNIQRVSRASASGDGRAVGGGVQVACESLTRH